jgi:hypothetical protein
MFEMIVNHANAKPHEQAWREALKDSATLEEAKKEAQGIIDFWNATLRPQAGERPRKLIRVVEKKEGGQ